MFKKKKDWQVCDNTIILKNTPPPKKEKNKTKIKQNPSNKNKRKASCQCDSKTSFLLCEQYQQFICQP